MFLRKAALRPVPGYAVVPDDAIEAVEKALELHEDHLQQVLDRGYHDLDNRQPVLGGWLAEEIGARGDELVQSLGYFLAVTVYLAFREAFPTRLHRIDESALRMAADTLTADEELRRNDPTEVLETDDVIGMTQPVIIDYVQHHVEQALAQADEGGIDLEELDAVYRALLVEIVALSHAVVSPSGHIGPPREALA